MSRLVYNPGYDHLELDGALVCEGNLLELYVMGYWLPGTVYRDASGWYLVTRDQVGIRLATDVRARLPDVALAVTFSARTEANLKHEKNT